MSIGLIPFLLFLLSTGCTSFFIVTILRDGSLLYLFGLMGAACMAAGAVYFGVLTTAESQRVAAPEDHPSTRPLQEHEIQTTVSHDSHTSIGPIAGEANLTDLPRCNSVVSAIEPDPITCLLDDSDTPDVAISQFDDIYANPASSPPPIDESRTEANDALNLLYIHDWLLEIEGSKNRSP